MAKVPTPGKSTCEDVAALLGLPLTQTVKSLVLAADETDEQGAVVKSQVWLLLVRGDHDLNEVKAGKIEASKRLALRHGRRDRRALRLQARLPGADRTKGVKIVADRTVAQMADFVCGANEADFHLTGVNWGRDLPEPDLVADIRNVVAGDLSPDGKGVLAIQRGIEVGHVFYLGTKYSKAMNASFLDENGKPALMEMGCYGIGVTRTVAAAIEQGHDARGIIWPDAIAPFTVVLCPIGMDRSSEVKSAAEKLYAELQALGVTCCRRPWRAPWRDVCRLGVDRRAAPRRAVGPRAQGRQVEYQGRRDEAATKLALADVVAHLKRAASRSDAPPSLLACWRCRCWHGPVPSLKSLWLTPCVRSLGAAIAASAPPAAVRQDRRSAGLT